MKSKITTRYISLTAAICPFLFAAGAQAQNMFVTDWDSPGAVLEYAPGSQTPTTFYSGGLGEAAGMTFDSAGDLFVADNYNGAINEITPGQSETTFVSGLTNPNGLAFDSAGDLFDADYAGNTIYEFVNNGTLSSIPTVFKSGLGNPADVAFDSAGDLFETDAATGNIYEFKNNGGTLSTTPTVYAAGFALPFGLAFNAAGDLFVSYDGDQGATSGGVTEIFQDDSQKSVVTGLDDPNDLAFDNAGDLFVMDAESGDITEVAANGTTSSFSTDTHVFGVAFQGVALPVPEPSSLALLAAGAAGLLIRRRK